MAHISQSDRKKRNLKRVSARGQIRALTNRNAELAQVVIQARNQIQHLATLLTYCVAQYGVQGTLTIPDAQLDALPEGARLQEYYQGEEKAIVLAAVIDAPAPQIEVVTPQIEIVSSLGSLKLPVPE